MINPKDPLNSASSLLGERGDPFSQFNLSLGAVGNNPHNAPRWEFDPAIGSWVRSNLSEEDYADTYGAMGTPQKQQARRRSAYPAGASLSALDLTAPNFGRAFSNVDRHPSFQGLQKNRGGQGYL